MAHSSKLAHINVRLHRLVAADVCVRGRENNGNIVKRGYGDGAACRGGSSGVSIRYWRVGEREIEIDRRYCKNNKMKNNIGRCGCDK